MFLEIGKGVSNLPVKYLSFNAREGIYVFRVRVLGG